MIEVNKSMNVVAHGDVSAYCKEHGYVIVERYKGKLEDYRGRGLVIVTDNCADKNDYYYTKYRLLRRRVVLLSTHWEAAELSDFVLYMNERDAEERRGKYRGRPRFGETPEEALIRDRIYELRDAGWTLKRIAEEVRRPDGRTMGISTIQVILKNRGE